MNYKTTEEYIEAVERELDLLRSKDVAKVELDKRLYNACAKWMVGPVREYLNKHKVHINDFPVSSENLFKLVELVELTSLIDFSVAKDKVFPELIKNTGETPWEIMERLGLLDMTDGNEAEKIVDEVLAKFPDKVTEYKNGKVGLLGMFVGEVKRACGNKIKPSDISEILTKKLSQ